MIRETADKYTQENYSVVVRVIQSEYIFLKRVMINTGYAFAGVEKILRETILIIYSLEIEIYPTHSRNFK